MRLSLNTLLNIFIIVFLSASVFFTVNVIVFKKGLQAPDTNFSIKSGTTVTVQRPLDGDELLVLYNDTRFVVRILGIKSYDVTVNDIMLQNVALRALRYLTENLSDKKVRLHFNTFKRDAKKRVLAYVHKGETDTGREMVLRGLTLVYTQYAFSREYDYLKAEYEARVRKRGLWGVPAAARRSLILKKIWKR